MPLNAGPSPSSDLGLSFSVVSAAELVDKKRVLIKQFLTVSEPISVTKHVIGWLSVRNLFRILFSLPSVYAVLCFHVPLGSSAVSGEGE